MNSTLKLIENWGWCCRKIMRQTMRCIAEWVTNECDMAFGYFSASVRPRFRIIELVVKGVVGRPASHPLREAFLYFYFKTRSTATSLCHCLSLMTAICQEEQRKMRNHTTKDIDAKCGTIQTNSGHFWSTQFIVTIFMRTDWLTEDWHAWMDRWLTADWLTELVRWKMVNERTNDDGDSDSRQNCGRSFIQDMHKLAGVWVGNYFCTTYLEREDNNNYNNKLGTLT